jgi:hypothetical protein
MHSKGVGIGYEHFKIKFQYDLAYKITSCWLYVMLLVNLEFTK